MPDGLVPASPGCRIADLLRSSKNPEAVNNCRRLSEAQVGKAP